MTLPFRETQEQGYILSEICKKMNQLNTFRAIALNYGRKFVGEGGTSGRASYTDAKAKWMWQEWNSEARQLAHVIKPTTKRADPPENGPGGVDM